MRNTPTDKVYIPLNQSRADFVYIDTVNKERGLIDSKASFAKTHNENNNDIKDICNPLREGLQQCVNIDNYINIHVKSIPFHKHGCSCIKFHDVRSIHNTKLIYVDPIIENDKIDNQRILRDIETYYKWLIEQLAEFELRDLIGSISEKNYLHTERYGGKDFIIFNHANEFVINMLKIFTRRKSMKLGISKEVIENIDNVEYFREFYSFRKKMKEKYLSSEYEIFHDGLILIFE